MLKNSISQKIVSAFDHLGQYNHNSNNFNYIIFIQDQLYPFLIEYLEKYQFLQMGNDQICKQCDTFDTEKDTSSKLGTPIRDRITVNVVRNNIASEKQNQSSPAGGVIENLGNNKFRIRYKGGEVYQGELKGTVKQGQGKMQWPGRGYYEGGWENDRASGKGICLQDGALYEGYFSNNEMIRGKYTFENETYEGQFFNQLYQGVGRLQKKGLYVYEGEFHQNLKNGKGKITFSSGNQFQGEFQGGKFNGFGKFKSSTHTYEGQFKNGEYHGKGRYTWNTGSTYDGNYQLGEKSGFGIFTNVDGTRYEGNWAHGKRHGKGTEVNKYGERIQGYFENGVKK